MAATTFRVLVSITETVLDRQPAVQGEGDAHRLRLPVPDRELPEYAVRGDVDDRDVAARFRRHPRLAAVRGEGDRAGIVADVDRAQLAAGRGVEDRDVVARLGGDVDLPAVARDPDPLGLH